MKMAPSLSSFNKLEQFLTLWPEAWGPQQLIKSCIRLCYPEIKIITIVIIIIIIIIIIIFIIYYYYCYYYYYNYYYYYY